jgi:hypothetical protein
MEELTTAARESTQRTETLKKRQTGNSNQQADPGRLFGNRSGGGEREDLAKTVSRISA